MTALPSNGGPAASHLRDHLAPALYAQLLSAGALPDTVVRAERDRGKAIIFSTHYLAEAELLCDRIGLLFRGRLLREGTPTALRAEAGAATLEEAFLSFVGLTEGPHASEARPA